MSGFFYVILTLFTSCPNHLFGLPLHKKWVQGKWPLYLTELRWTLTIILQFIHSYVIFSHDWTSLAWKAKTYCAMHVNHNCPHISEKSGSKQANFILLQPINCKVQVSHWLRTVWTDIFPLKLLNSWHHFS